MNLLNPPRPRVEEGGDPMLQHDGELQQELQQRGSEQGDRERAGRNERPEFDEQVQHDEIDQGCRQIQRTAFASPRAVPCGFIAFSAAYEFLGLEHPFCT
jgi:hypothetical protein